MAYPFRDILCPIQFDQNSLGALEMGKRIAADYRATLHLLHVVTSDANETRLVSLHDPLSEARTRLKTLAVEHLEGTRYQILIKPGDPARIVCETARDLDADLIVMASHGRSGLARLFVGSVAERVLREASCPVLAVRPGNRETPLVRTRMNSSPVTIGPAESLAAAQELMHHGEIQCLPVVDGRRLLGVVSSRDLRPHLKNLAATRVEEAMIHESLTVTPTTSLEEAAKLMLKHNLSAVAVVENGELAGLIQTSDVLATYVK
jgi:nucleotide-binding universal stress UspA family protein/CBS domain-containing protein